MEHDEAEDAGILPELRGLRLKLGVMGSSDIVVIIGSTICANRFAADAKTYLREGGSNV